MGQANSKRIGVREGGTSFVSPDLGTLIKELDGRLVGADLFMTITRSSGLISKVEYFAEAARTTLLIERTISRTAGTGGVLYVTGVLTKFFNLNATEDSRVTDAFPRTSDKIVTNEGPLATTESTEL